MLKISIKDGPSRRLLVLEGRIIAPWTDELTKAACQDDANHIASRQLVIDLQGVSDISADGEETLYSLMVQGAKFRGGGIFIRQVMERIAQRMRLTRFRNAEIGLNGEAGLLDRMISMSEDCRSQPPLKRSLPTVLIQFLVLLIRSLQNQNIPS
jgi:anti-anti-sigma regulatory factor